VPDELSFRTVMPREKLLATCLCCFVSKNTVAMDAKNCWARCGNRLQELPSLRMIHREIHIDLSEIQRRGDTIACDRSPVKWLDYDAVNYCRF